MALYVDLATIQDTDPGDILTAAWCDQVRENGEAQEDPPAVSFFNSIPQNVADATSVVMTADSENFDNFAMHSTGVNTSRGTIQVAGRYLLVATCIFATGASGERNVSWLVNGTTALEASKLNANTSGSQNTVVTATRAETFAVGDWFEVRSRHRGTGGALDVTLEEAFAYRITR